MTNEFTLDEFGRKMYLLQNEVKRGKSMNSMTVRELVLYFVDFSRTETYNRMMFDANAAHQLRLYERTKRQ